MIWSFFIDGASFLPERWHGSTPTPDDALKFAQIMERGHGFVVVDATYSALCASFSSCVRGDAGIVEAGRYGMGFDDLAFSSASDSCGNHAGCRATRRHGAACLPEQCRNRPLQPDQLHSGMGQIGVEDANCI